MERLSVSLMTLLCLTLVVLYMKDVALAERFVYVGIGYLAGTLPQKRSKHEPPSR